MAAGIKKDVFCLFSDYDDDDDDDDDVDDEDNDNDIVSSCSDQMFQDF